MRILWVLLCVLMLVGCREPVSQDVLIKMDAALRRHVVEGSRDDIAFIGRWDQEITDVIRVEIEATGVQLQTVAGESFTARGDTKSIVKLAGLKSVVRLESGKRVRLLDKTERR